MMMNENLSAGSTFLGLAFSSLIYPSESVMSDKEFNDKVKQAGNLVRIKGFIDAPLIIKEIGCDAKTANKILNALIDGGIITQI